MTTTNKQELIKNVGTRLFNLDVKMNSKPVSENRSDVAMAIRELIGILYQLKAAVANEENPE